MIKNQKLDHWKYSSLPHSPLARRYEMKALIAALLTLSFVGLAAAEEYTARPDVYDYERGDGYMEPGTDSNPYRLYDSSGNQRGTLEPSCRDYDPDDGYQDPGSPSNPWKVRTD
jgi:hypothetical protein